MSHLAKTIEKAREWLFASTGWLSIPQYYEVNAFRSMMEAKDKCVAHVLSQEQQLRPAPGGAVELVVTCSLCGCEGTIEVDAGDLEWDIESCPEVKHG